MCVCVCYLLVTTIPYLSTSPAHDITSRRLSTFLILNPHIYMHPPRLRYFIFHPALRFPTRPTCLGHPIDCCYYDYVLFFRYFPCDCSAFTIRHGIQTIFPYYMLIYKCCIITSCIVNSSHFGNNYIAL